MVRSVSGAGHQLPGRQFSHSLSGEMIWGQFKHVTSIVRCISTIITSAPPRINRHEIPEAGDPYTQDSELQIQTTGGAAFLYEVPYPNCTTQKMM